MLSIDSPPQGASVRPMHDYGTTPSDLVAPVYDENQMRVLNERYLARKPSGEVETTTEFLWRVAYSVARAEERYPGHTGKRLEMAHTFYEMMRKHEFLPNTPCLVNAGRPLGALSACYVLDVPDSMDGIARALRAQMLIQKSGGGTGFSFGDLRAEDTNVESTGRGASGPISFMRVFDAATETIKQGGVRRGANMAVLRIDHPDVMEFMRCKKELDHENNAAYLRLADSKMYTETQLAHLKQEMLQRQFSNFNISLGISNAFMNAVLYCLDHPNTAPLINFGLVDQKGELAKTVPVTEMWEAVVEGAWQNGEPGVLFLDHPEANPLPGLGPITATNPCGEQLLHGNDSCNLGSINLGLFYNDARNEVDWPRLTVATAYAIRFLDDVIDENEYAMPEIKEMVQNNRRVGLGIMGFADLIAKMKISYGSPEAITLAENVMRHIYIKADLMSRQLARDRGVFPNWKLSNVERRRNVALLSIAPTGTISMIAGCSYGCEPYFAIAYTKSVMKGKDGRPVHLYYIVPSFEERALAEGVLTDALLQRIADAGGSVQKLDLSPSLTQGFTVTADISMTEHVDMLCAFQKHVDNAVSKTINAPNSATRQEVSDAIIRAWKGGAKGMTIYRDGSRTEQIITLNHDLKKATNA